MGRRDKAEEVFAPYDEYLDGSVWPSVTDHGEILSKYLDTMAPQHCAAALYKLKRWNEQQWADEVSVERHWSLLQRKTLVRMLQARASGTEDYSTIHDGAPPLDAHLAGRLLIECMFIGSGEEVLDHMLVVKLAERAAVNLYSRGYVVLHDRS